MSEQETRLDEFVDEEIRLLSDEPEGVRLTIDEMYPQGWKYAELSDICELNSGFSWNKEQETDSPEGGAIPVIKIGNVRDGYLDLSDILYLTGVSDEDLQENKARKDWLLMIGSNGSGERVGHCGLIEDDMEFVYASFLYGLHPDSDYLLPRCLFYFLNQPKVQRRLTSFTAGSTSLKNLNKSVVSNLSVPIPPLEEQRKIASVLYNVDQAIQKTEEIIEQTHHVKSGLMQDVFHGKHGSYDGYSSTPVGEIPDHWDVVSIGDIVDTAQYGISESLSEEGQYPVFRMNNIENGYMVEEPMKYIDLDDEEFAKYRVEDGDILFNRTNSLELVGKTGIYEMEGDHVFASYLVRLQTNEKADSYYLNYYMNSAEGQNRMMDFATKGVSQANINANSIQQVKLPLPPLDEQKQITERIKTIDEQIDTNNQYKSQLQRFKQGLMQDLLSGEVRTNDAEIEVLPEVAQHG